MDRNCIDLNSASLDRCNQKYYDKAFSEYGIGFTQYLFLSSIYENEGMMMNELAILGNFDKGTVTKSISKLEEMGLVKIENSDEDKRSKKLYTTQKSKDMMPKLYSIRQEWTNYLSNDLSEEEKNIYSVIMNKLLDKAKEYSSASLVSDEIVFYGLQKLTLLDYPGKMAATIFTGGCNFRCPFCHNKQLVFLNQSEVEINANDVLNYLNERKKLLDGVCISGGEPLLQEGLENFLREVRKTDLKIKLDTNGALSSKLKRIVEEGLVDYVAMDIKNEKDLYPLTTGLENFSTKEVEESVEFLKKGIVDYEFRTTLVKEFHRSTNFEKIGEWLKGAKHYYLQNFEDHGTCIEEGLHALDKEEIFNIKDIVSRYVDNVSIRGLEEEKE